MIALCVSCQVGRLQRRNLVYLQWHEKGLLVVNRMPAVVCDLCGDQVYDYDAVEHLQRLLWSPPPGQGKRSSNSRT